MNFDPPLPDATRQMLARLGTQIEYTANEPNGLVNLARSEVEDEDLRHLVFYPGIDALILEGTEISDGGLRFIGEMTSLEHLRLLDAPISDQGLTHLLDLSKLERLNIGCGPGCMPAGLRPAPAERVRRNQITDRGLGYLTDLPALRILNLMATRVTDNGLSQHIPQLPALIGLSFAYLDISDAALLALESVAWLERINLTHTAVTNDGIVNFVSGKAHTLQHLNLSNTGVSDAALTECLPNTQLIYLSLMDTGITDAACKACINCEWLSHLRLNCTDVTDDGVRELTNCANLRRLDLLETKVTDTSLAWLSDTKVEQLGLGYTSVTDAGVPALTDFTTLQSLDLQGTSITDRGLRFLVSATGLRRLYLERTKITNAGIEFLLHLPLESLSLNPKIDDTGLATLSRHTSLRQLAIWNCRVTSWEPLKNLDCLRVLLIDDSVQDLIPLRSLNELEVLLLWGDNFSATEFAKLRLSLPNCQIKNIPSRKSALCEFRSLCEGH